MNVPLLLTVAFSAVVVFGSVYQIGTTAAKARRIKVRSDRRSGH